MVTGQQAADWLSRIVQIPSVNPAYAGPRAGTPGEARLAAQVAEWFRLFGAEVFTEDVHPNRPNTYAIWRGRSARWAALDVHLDTVGVEQMPDDPFSGRIGDGRVYGRGAADTKASLGVALALLEEMQHKQQTPGPNLLLVATADEERGSRGAPNFAAWVRARGIALDQLLVAEPTLCAPVCGHRGQVRLAFEIEGVATHSSQPHLGKNAISAAARLVLAIDAEYERLQAMPWKNRLGAPVLSATTIQGGRGTNVIPDRCVLNMDRRVVDGERLEEVRDGLLEMARQHCPLPFQAEVTSFKNAFSQSPETPWVRQMAVWSGQEPGIAPYCTNAHAYNGLAQECLVMGPGSIDQAHGSEEWVAISELKKMADILAQWWEIT
jgi:acetylornithine deacetylase/succinyl-diaminopimelate desuccinylase-like protein